MFDGSDKHLLFLGLLVAGLISLVANNRAPQSYDPIPIDMANLPAAPTEAEAGGAPLQTAVPRQTVDLGSDFQATLLYGYTLDGLVVTRREFRRDATSAVSPLDLGIVWGDLADSPAITGLRFRAGPRMVSYRYETADAFPTDWEQQITNNHLVPASDVVREALMSIDVGQRVRITGYLVSVTGTDIRPWRSSTRRDDSSLIGGCEIILVRSVEVIRSDA